jgi:hypothetical protein
MIKEPILQPNGHFCLDESKQIVLTMNLVWTLEGMDYKN